MFRQLFLSLMFFFVLCPITRGDTFNLTSYYPAPTANYSSIKLIPISAITPSTSCSIGTLYVNQSANNSLYYCSATVTGSIFLPMSGVWTLNSNDLYLTDTTTPLSKKVSIGSTTPTFKLTLTTDGGILASGEPGTGATLTTSGAGTRLVWYSKKASFLAGTVDGTQWDDANVGNNSIALGHNNTIIGDRAKVFGGEGNQTGYLPNDYPSSTVLGGKNNNNSSYYYSYMGGGENNRIVSQYSSFIAGGKDNELNYIDETDCWNAILGGSNNFMTKKFNIIHGGYQNRITTLAPDPSNLNGYSSIAGGSSNTINGIFNNVISGGRQNSILLDATEYATIGGGQQNSVSADYGTISGGQLNTVTSSAGYGTISGGYSNTVSSTYTAISGGRENTISGTYSAIAGGYLNNVSGAYSTILGGERNSVSGAYSIILGGTDNVVDGDYSLAVGRNMNLGANADHTFIWGYSATAITPIQTADAFLIYSGTVGIRDTNPGALLEINVNNSATDDIFALTPTSAAAAGSDFIVKNNGYVGVGLNNPIYPMQFISGAYVSTDGKFMSASSRAYKENIEPLSLNQAQELFHSLKPVTYKYKNSPSETYAGFIAEDVPDLLTDPNHKGLAPLDFAAVLTKIIQHQKSVIANQKQTQEELLKSMDELENHIKTIETKRK